MSNADGARSFAFGFCAGAVLGAIGALMMAPVSGRKLRSELSREGRRLSNRISETTEELKDKSCDVYESAAEVASDAARSLNRATHSLAR
ncbi:MAG TPA: YtxH domain-containing protein [Vicinamibacteria bacterium]|nr:YtxH domain-containing protein [Vicinamibacteria bacterium]